MTAQLLPCASRTLTATLSLSEFSGGEGVVSEQGAKPPAD
jgi:hypothetical protein